MKTLSYDFPKLQHSKNNSFCDVHLSQSFWKTVKVTKRSCDVTPRSKYQKSKPMVPLSLWCNSDNYLQRYGILNRMAHSFYAMAAIYIVSVEPYRFSNIP